MKITNTQSWRVGARALLVGLVACLVCSLSFAARQESPRPAPSQPGAPHDGPRERWARMSPQEREQMLQRFEKFKQMDDAQRREVIERWQQVQRLERGTREALHGELSKLGPEQQRECVRGYVGRELFERGRAMREMLPRDLLEKIERAAPEEAQRLLDEFRRMRPELADRALFELGRDLDLDPAEVERLRALPEEQKRTEMFVLRRRQIEQRFTREGLPSWLTQQEWDELRALDGPLFWERWFARMRQLGFSSSDRHHGERGGKRGGERGGEHRGGGRGEGDPRGARDGEAQDSRLSPERVREVLEQLRPDPKWFNELWKLSPEERCAARAAIETRLRERLLEVLAASPDLATPQEVETLRALQGREFFEAVYQRMRALGIGLPPPREKRPPGEGFGPPGGSQQPSRPPHEHPPQQHPPQQNAPQQNPAQQNPSR